MVHSCIVRRRMHDVRVVQNIQNQCHRSSVIVIGLAIAGGVWFFCFSVAALGSARFPAALSLGPAGARRERGAAGGLHGAPVNISITFYRGEGRGEGMRRMREMERGASVAITLSLSLSLSPSPSPSRSLLLPREPPRPGPGEGVNPYRKGKKGGWKRKRSRPPCALKGWWDCEGVSSEGAGPCLSCEAVSGGAPSSCRNHAFRSQSRALRSETCGQPCYPALRTSSNSILNSLPVGRRSWGRSGPWAGPIRSAV